MHTVTARIEQTLTADLDTRRGVTVAVPDAGRAAERSAGPRKILAVLDRDKPPDAAFLTHVHGMAAATAGRLTFVSVGDGPVEFDEEFDVNPVVLWGEAAHRICHYSDFMDADVIAIAEKPRGLWSRLWRRSVADELQALSSRPVQLINPDSEAPNRYRRILCVVGLDGSDDQVLNSATQLAVCTDARIALLHVVPELSEGALSSSAGWGNAPLSIPVAEERMRLLASRLPVSTISRILVGPEVQNIGRAAADSTADLVIVGRPQPGVWAGPCVDPSAVLRHTQCPVLSVPAFGTHRPNQETYAKVAFVLRDLTRPTDS